MQTRMISLLVEWCETEDQRSPSVCYDDICFMYDASNSDTPIRAVKKGPQNNCYVKVPHPILDPVMECNMERLQLFYQRTWWCNIEVFLCCQAKARFIHKKFLVKYPDHEKDGIFEADPQQYVEEGLANLLDADAESDQERQEKSDVWDNLRRFFVQQMIEKELDFMTFYDFKKLALISADHPNLSKSDMWDALEKMMSCELQSGSSVISLTFALKYMERYAQMCRGRGANAENMKAFYRAMVPVAKKGSIHEDDQNVAAAEQSEDLGEALDEVTKRRAEFLQKLGEQPVEDYQLLKNVKHKTFPAATIMSQMWYAVEDMILQAWTEHALI
ncbi:unnamed protein product, partial [Symbiodinium microadriaticum]